MYFNAYNNQRRFSLMGHLTPAGDQLKMPCNCRVPEQTTEMTMLRIIDQF
jgi:hypothetical protein